MYRTVGDMGKSNQTFRNMWMGRERQGNLGKSSKPWKHWDLLRYDTGIRERLGKWGCDET